MSLDLARTVAAIHAVAGDKALLHAPEVAGNEWVYVKECLDTEWVSTVGAYVDRFERMVAEFTGASHAVATVNGTAALHMCLKLAGVGPGDEVITPSLTFIATANAVAYCGAFPHFADVEERSLGLDAAKLDAHLTQVGARRDGVLINRWTGRVIRAVCCMHTFGHACDLDAVAEVCARHGVVLVEDAAESLGSTYKGRHTGNHGLVSSLSFNGNKIVTTGGGGMILTSDEALAKRAKHLTTTAKTPHPFLFNHDEVGYNYRLPNLNAAMGCAQMEQLPGFLARKRLLAERYAAAFDGIEGIRFFREPDYGRSNYWLNVLLLDKPDTGLVHALLERANGEGLQCRPAWTPMHDLPMYRDCPRMDLSVTVGLNQRLINIPSSPRLAG
ncbi:LegC family aminotransferase [Paramagnetospirillum kuznetsovii]|uniref:LegC family aminotransferase n=1 Tax=Paramagnetospirillum kuznetsovii TaxID=2053833 RepID=UPI001EFCEBE1|nr:LegC family aminotransferase [Paramagnetospirillum kuznetsovii]